MPEISRSGNHGIVLKAFACVVVLCVSFQMPLLSNLLLPMFCAQIEAIEPALKVDRLAVGTQHEQGEPLYLLDISARAPLKVGPSIVPTGTSISASTLIGHSTQNFLLLFLLVTWAGRSEIKSLLLRIALAAPLWIAIEMIDTPMVLLGAVFDLLFSNLAPTETNFVVAWTKIQENGGRLAFALCAAVIVLAVESLSIRKRNTTLLSV